MVRPRMNEIFARVNEKTGVNDFSVAKLLHPQVLVFFTQHISAIMSKMANFKRSNFTSKEVSNLSLQENRPIMELPTFMT